MPKSFQKFMSLFGKIKSREISYDKEGIYPMHNWEVLLFSVSIVLLILAGISLYFYMQVRHGKLFTIEGENGASMININDAVLRKTINDINSREASSTELTENKIIFPDPSN